MERQLPLNTSAFTSLGPGDQACNECKRRKGRCDKQLPECGPCARNRRHCLYEKHAKTPLTRKHLTAVEERLAQTAARLRLAEKRAEEAEAKLAALVEHASINPHAPGADSSQYVEPYDLSVAHESDFLAGGVLPLLTQPHCGTTEVLSQEDVHYRLEEPPSEDFSWDENSSHPVTDHSQVHGDTGVIDGMASLSVDDQGTGYLGVASGAAVLRLLLPDADIRGKSRHPQNETGPDSEFQMNQGWVPTPLFQERNIGEINLDAAIDAYFSCYHLAYPIVHEPTFRAEYSQVIPRPNGHTWNALAYIIGAIGLFASATEPTHRDLDLFEAAKSNMSMTSLESGNVTLVQVLALMSNYLQKRNKPNSGYNYLGLALHTAMGLGLHKEFPSWHVAPLSLEIRRRVWWTLFVFFSGACVTFGRPLSWPSHGVEVALPLNIDDKDLTHASVTLPPARINRTMYSAVAIQARFHLATNDIYAKVTSSPYPSAEELLHLDEARIETWRLLWMDDFPVISEKFNLSRNIMEWRMRNFRIIMYRPLLIKQVFRMRTDPAAGYFNAATKAAIEKCIGEAAASIASIHNYWFHGSQNVMAAWYALYFIFQACLIPVIIIRNAPASELARGSQHQIKTVLEVMQSMQYINPTSKECHRIITQLCDGFLHSAAGPTIPDVYDGLPAIDESPQTQLSGVYTMMWPNANTADIDLDALMPDESWDTFLTDMLDSPHNISEALPE